MLYYQLHSTSLKVFEKVYTVWYMIHNFSKLVSYYFKWVRQLLLLYFFFSDVKHNRMLFNIKLFKINNKLKFFHNHTCQSKLLSNFIFLYFSIHMLNILSENGRQCKFSFSRLLLIYIRYLSMSEHLYIAHFYHDYTSGIYSWFIMWHSLQNTLF